MKGLGANIIYINLGCLRVLLSLCVYKMVSGVLYVVFGISDLQSGYFDILDLAF